MQLVEHISHSNLNQLTLPAKSWQKKTKKAEKKVRSKRPVTRVGDKNKADGRFCSGGMFVKYREQMLVNGSS